MSRSTVGNPSSVTGIAAFWRGAWLLLCAIGVTACGGSGGDGGSAAALSNPSSVSVTLASTGGADGAPLAVVSTPGTAPGTASGTAPGMTPSTTAATALLTLEAPSGPRSSLGADEIGIVVIEGDALSERIAAAYLRARGIPAAHIARISLPLGQDDISPAELAAARAQIDAQLPAKVQATLLTFNQPSRVRGSCRRSRGLARRGAPALARARQLLDEHHQRPGLGL